jgi:hypothetical protein
MSLRARKVTSWWVGVVFVGVARVVGASFSGTDIFIPSVGRGSGTGGSEWYTCIWVYNPGSTAVNAQYFFLERNQANPTPAMVPDVIPPGVAIRIDNIVQMMFGQSAKFGALRVVAAAKVFVSARTYSKPPGGEDKDSVGQFYAGIPASFAIGSGQSTQLVGVYQTSPQSDSQFRYNFGFVEVTGSSATVRVTARDFMNASLGSKDYTLGGFEPRQYNITDLLPHVDSPNLRLEVEVIAGSGKVIAFGSGLANRSNDPSTFEMSFRDELLGGSGSGLTAVAHDSSLTGDGTSSSKLGIATSGVASTHLASAAVTPGKISASGSFAGQVLTSDGTNAAWQTPSTGGGSGGITSVVHDATLSGSGTTASPLSITNNGVTQAKLNAGGAVASGKVLGTDGTNLQWQSAGSGGSLTLPFIGSASTAASADAFYVQNTGSGRAIRATSQSDTALWAVSNSGTAVAGWSTSGDGVEGKTSASGKSGVWGHSTAGAGVTGMSDATDGVVGRTNSTEAGAAGVHASNTGGSIAIYSDGDIYATGAFRGNLGSGGGAPFPREAWDSGWVKVEQDEVQTLRHNLGGNVDNYVVDMEVKSPDGTVDMPVFHTNSFGKYEGARWYDLTTTTIKVRRASSDMFAPYVRIRIWVRR